MRLAVHLRSRCAALRRRPISPHHSPPQASLPGAPACAALRQPRLRRRLCVIGRRLREWSPTRGRVLALTRAHTRALSPSSLSQVDDVTTCNNYIPCDDLTRSEIVVPVWGYNLTGEPDVRAAEAAAKGVQRKLIAVLDIDTGELAGFNGEAKARLEALVERWFIKA